MSDALCLGVPDLSSLSVWSVSDALSDAADALTNNFKRHLNKKTISCVRRLKERDQVSSPSLVSDALS